MGWLVPESRNNVRDRENSWGTRYVNITAFVTTLECSLSRGDVLLKRRRSAVSKRCDLLNILWSIVVPERVRSKCGKRRRWAYSGRRGGRVRRTREDWRRWGKVRRSANRKKNKKKIMTVTSLGRQGEPASGGYPGGGGGGGERRGDGTGGRVGASSSSSACLRPWPGFFRSNRFLLIKNT